MKNTKASKPEQRTQPLQAERHLTGTEYPDFNETYYDKYMEARRDVGFKDTPEEAKKNFLQYLVEDCELPGIDSDFTLLANDVVQDILVSPESKDEVKIMERFD